MPKWVTVNPSTPTVGFITNKLKMTPRDANLSSISSLYVRSKRTASTASLVQTGAAAETAALLTINTKLTAAR